MVQDGPPPGGYPPVRFQRIVPQGRPSSIALFAGGAAVIAAGMYVVGTGNQRRRATRAELLEYRRHLVPFLQAEEDARYVAARDQQLAKEAEVMKNVPGWKVGASVYNHGGWTPPINWNP